MAASLVAPLFVLLLSASTLLAAQSQQHPDMAGLLALKASLCGAGTPPTDCLPTWRAPATARAGDALCDTFDGVGCNNAVPRRVVGVDVVLIGAAAATLPAPSSDAAAAITPPTAPPSFSAIAPLPYLLELSVQCIGDAPAVTAGGRGGTALPSWWTDGSGLPRLTSLRVTACGFSGPVPAAALSSPTTKQTLALTSLALPQNHLSGTLPSVAPDGAAADSLTLLDLSGNAALGGGDDDDDDDNSGLLPDSWAALRALRYLYLAGTNVSGLPASWVAPGALPSLVLADLAAPRLRSTPPPRAWLRRFCPVEGAFVCLRRKGAAGGGDGGGGGAHHYACEAYIYGSSDRHADAANACDHALGPALGVWALAVLAAAAVCALRWRQARAAVDDEDEDDDYDGGVGIGSATAARILRTPSGSSLSAPLLLPQPRARTPPPLPLPARLRPTGVPQQQLFEPDRLDSLRLPCALAAHDPPPPVPPPRPSSRASSRGAGDGGGHRGDDSPAPLGPHSQTAAAAARLSPLDARALAVLVEAGLLARLLALWGFAGGAKAWASWTLLSLMIAPHVAVALAVQVQAVAAACLPPALTAAAAPQAWRGAALGEPTLVVLYGRLAEAAPSWAAWPALLLAVLLTTPPLALLVPCVLPLYALGGASADAAGRYVAMIHASTALLQSLAAGVVLTVLWGLGNGPLGTWYLDAPLFFLPLLACLGDAVLALDAHCARRVREARRRRRSDLDGLQAPVSPVSHPLHDGV